MRRGPVSTAVAILVNGRFYSKTDARGRVRFTEDLTRAKLYRVSPLSEIVKLRRLLAAKGYRSELRVIQAQRA